jgi:hypothetical protein
LILGSQVLAEGVVRDRAGPRKRRFTLGSIFTVGVSFFECYKCAGLSALTDEYAMK